MSAVVRVWPVILLSACSMFVDADLDALGPDIDIGGDCADIETCDDGIACTNDFCDAAVGACVNEPVNDACDPGQRCDPDDGCVGGDTPCERDQDCVDDSGCSVGRCDGDRCAFEPVDADEDGAPKCDDCDDLSPDVHPGAGEVCGNGADDDCNGAADDADPVCQATGCGLPLSIIDHGEIEGEVRGESALQGETCSRGDGPEAIVELVVQQESDLVLSTEESELDTVLSVREGCDGEEIACADNRSQARGWMDSKLFLLGVAPGTYTIVVDSAGRGGRFRLRVDRDNPRAPTCERPLDITGGGTVVGRTDGPDSDQGASCSEPTGPAAAFAFRLDGWTEVTVSTEESGFDLVQEVVREGCGGETAPEGCLDQTAVGEVYRGALNEGPWAIVLDGYQGASGRYVLRFFP